MTELKSNKNKMTDMSKKKKNSIKNTTTKYEFFLKFNIQKSKLETFLYNSKATNTPNFLVI